MGASFNGSNQSIVLTFPLPSPYWPVTVGQWCYPFSVGVQGCPVSFGNPSSTANGGVFSTRVQVAGGLKWEAIVRGTGTPANGGTPVANEWQFVLSRFVSTSKVTIAVLYQSGSIVQGAYAGAATSPIAGITQVGIGGRITNPIDQFWGGYLGETWYTNTDIYPDSNTLDEALIRKLAYEGPFSVPNIGASVVDYRALDKGASFYLSNTYVDGMSGYNLGAVTNNNSVTSAPHPSLPYTYVRPSQTKNFLMV